MDRNNIEKIAHTPEDRLLLAKVWDKINAGMRKNIMANSAFLSPRELEMTRYLFGQQPGLCAFGGYEDAERKMLVFLPDYLDESYLFTEDSPVVCIEASYFEKDALSHRDFLGALMGAGISRETVGDISTETGRCHFFVTAEIAPYILQNFTSAGRTAVHLTQIPLEEVTIAEPETKEIRDTVSSLRLDSIISFEPLDRRAMEAIAGKYLKELCARLADTGVQLTLPEELTKYLADRCKTKDGARYMRRLVQDQVEGPLALYLLKTGKKQGKLVGSLENGRLQFHEK